MDCEQIPVAGLNGNLPRLIGNKIRRNGNYKESPLVTR
jgi:hypothetical protein